MSKVSAYFLVIVIILIVLIALYFIYVSSIGPSSPTTINLNNNQIQSAETVRLGSTVALGSFLVDSNGRTLYYFANDAVNKSNCTGQCLTTWPAFYAPSIIVSGILDASNFGQITSSANASQTTYYGWPLYYYSGDKNPGDTNGQGFQNIWFAASSPFFNVMLMNNAVSKTYLADINGKAIYYFKSDIKGTTTTNPKSNCTGQCLSIWPIFDESQVIAPALSSASNFKEFTRSDGQTQLSYKGWPLYTYSGDINSGDTKGDGFNKLWYLVKP